MIQLKHISKSLSLIVLFLLVNSISCKKEKTTSVADIPVTPNDFLAGNNYDKLVVEIQYVTGSAPTTATLDNLRAFLEQRLNKPEGITIVQSSIATPGRATLTLEDVKDIEGAYRSQQKSGKTIAAYFLFADADYASNVGSSKVLGMAYGPSSMVIFEKTIKDFSGGIGQPSVTTLESTVIEHEFGHILGLVNNGSVLQSAHQDTPNGKHCNDNKCLMYYAVENSDFVANLMGGNIPALNAACITDLKANGGK